jgi:hypothetical protein
MALCTVVSTHTHTHSHTHAVKTVGITTAQKDVATYSRKVARTTVQRERERGNCLQTIILRSDVDAKRADNLHPSKLTCALTPHRVHARIFPFRLARFRGSRLRFGLKVASDRPGRCVLLLAVVQEKKISNRNVFAQSEKRSNM